MPDDQILIDAFELAERILDELTRPDQNWSAVEHLASALARLAAGTRRSPHARRSRERGAPGRSDERG